MVDFAIGEVIRELGDSAIIHRAVNHGIVRYRNSTVVVGWIPKAPNFSKSTCFFDPRSSVIGVFVFGCGVILDLWCVWVIDRFRHKKMALLRTKG